MPVTVDVITLADVVITVVTVVGGDPVTLVEVVVRVSTPTSWGGSDEVSVTVLNTVC